MSFWTNQIYILDTLCKDALEEFDREFQLLQDKKSSFVEKLDQSIDSISSIAKFDGSFATVHETKRSPSVTGPILPKLYRKDSKIVEKKIEDESKLPQASSKLLSFLKSKEKPALGPQLASSLEMIRKGLQAQKEKPKVKTSVDQAPPEIVSPVVESVQPSTTVVAPSEPVKPVVVEEPVLVSQEPEIQKDTNDEQMEVDMSLVEQDEVSIQKEQVPIEPVVEKPKESVEKKLKPALKQTKDEKTAIPKPIKALQQAQQALEKERLEKEKRQKLKEQVKKPEKKVPEKKEEPKKKIPLVNEILKRKLMAKTEIQNPILASNQPTTQPNASILDAQGNLPDIASDSEDERSTPRKAQKASWAMTPVLMKQLQDQTSKDPEQIFGFVPDVELSEIFPKKKLKIRPS